MPVDFDDDVATLHRKPLPSAAAPLGAHFVVTVTAGPDRGQRVEIDGSRPTRLLVGTSPSCELRLTDRHASRRHLALELDGDELRLEDLESTNGTFAGGVRVLAAKLRGGEAVTVGNTTLRVERGEPTAATIPAETRFGRVIGESPEMRRLYPLCRRFAAADVPIVIEGETGTGKEMMAEAIHEASGRATGPFVVFDCTTVAPSLLEAALFGHERGAFTGAVATRTGVFEQAHGGTLLIDEIGDLELSLQPKLLRALERGEVRRVGGDRWIRVNVRLLAATRRDLDKEVQEGRFRDDLFFRLAVARIELPPLRRRQGDVPVLAQAFWSVVGNGGPLPADFLARHAGYAWPGNLRELQNAVARRAALGDLANEASLRGPTEAPQGWDVVERVLAMDLPLTRARERVIEEFERRYLERVLAANGGNVVRAAQAAGVARRYFQILRARQRDGG